MRGAGPFFVSFGLHVLVLVGVVFGWLTGFLSRPVDPDIVPIIPVELLSEAELTDRVSVQEMVRAEEPEPEPEPEPAAEEPEPTPDPEPLPPEPEPVPERPAPEPEPAPEPQPAEPEPAPEPTPAEPEPAKEAPEPEPEPQPEPAEPEPAPEEPEDVLDLASLDDALKDLTPDDRAPSSPREVAEGTATGERDQEQIGLGDKLTVSEEALLQSAFEQCWNRQFGVPDQERLIVSVRIELNPDGTLDGSPRVLNDGQISRSGNRYWAVARQRALSAVIDCAPYDMVPERLLSEPFVFNFKPPAA
ncbi:cell envelope integrity protein TolA [Parvularcula dongshanensis]|uniref:Energy transducer TonB n=1 Tax=Parvularcula dongshanensis TaxID=1173995 RepID=A0A840I642_9PROT|nr:cell envelope integrity protein TolA [Parvularcula dongshanensis]MBB4660349.1 hypothetical protein [Parvularcula dongshanensis]